MPSIDPPAFIERIREGMQDEPGIRALFLAGSHGSGKADAYSDIDFVALAEEGDHAAVASAWKALVESIAPVVFWQERRMSWTLLNAVTEDWLRCDLTIFQPGALRGRARDTVKPLIDRGGFYDALPATLSPAQPNANHVQYLINEFIRVLGLLPVGIGRGEYVVGVTGTGLLRDMLIQLLTEEVPMPDKGGALHLSRVLPEADMRLLEGLPYPRPDRAAIIAANLATARAFFPRARALAERLGLSWPTAFEEATRRNLQRIFGAEADVSW
jgi:hypothetical protein